MGDPACFPVLDRLRQQLLDWIEQVEGYRPVIE